MRAASSEPAASLRQESASASDLSFDAIYEAHFTHVTRWVRAFGGTSGDVEDLAQETFMVVRRRLPELSGRELNVKAWLYAIAKNVVRDHKRRAWVRRWVPWSHQELDEIETPHDNPSEALARREATRTLESILSSMTPMHRATFILFEIEGYTGEEIADMEQIPLNTVYTRLFNARKNFYKLLAQTTGLAEEGAEP